jgi:hypothetical protein
LPKLCQTVPKIEIITLTHSTKIKINEIRWKWANSSSVPTEAKTCTYLGSFHCLHAFEDLYFSRRIKRGIRTEQSYVYTLETLANSSDAAFRSLQCQSRVAIFFVTQYTKTKENMPNYHSITMWPYDLKIFQMTIKYPSILHLKAHQNLPKLEFLVWKQTIWQPFVSREFQFCWLQTQLNIDDDLSLLCLFRSIT